LRTTREKWPSLAGSHWRVLPNGYEPADVHCPSDVSLEKDYAPFCFLFAGTLYDSLVPERLLATLEEAALSEPSLVRRVRFRFVGQQSEMFVQRVTASPCSDLFDLRPPVSRTEIWRELVAAPARLIVLG